METTYDVRIYKTDVYTSRKKNGRNTYWVRWKIARQAFKRPFMTAALAESFCSELVAAARKGEAFRLLDGLPVSSHGLIRTWAGMTLRVLSWT